MFRKSALAMAMLGALTTGNVVALGLGEIELKSALNQPLSAEVELLSATEAELDELKVEVASPEAFANAGIERSLFLTKLKFDVRTGADGRPVVLITSRDVVREPFLDFLLEVSWSKGRMLREYTVLIDPPVTMPAATPVPRTPVVQTTAPPTRVAQPPVPGRVTHTAQMPPVSVAPGEYLTQHNDTLWRVAQEVRPDSGVSIEQTMLGLQRANPEAFINGNINNLKAGYILRVPNREELTSISKAEASREAQAQYAAWREARGLPVSAQTADAGQPAGAADAGVAPEPQLQLVAPDSAEAGSAVGSGESAELEGLRRELMMANEALEEQRRQGEEMSGRLGVLEEQIVNMQRLIQLKDDELARLQSQVGEGTAEAAGESGEQLLAETEAVEATEATTPTEETLTTPMTEEAGAMPGAEVSDAGQPTGGAFVDQTMDDAETVGPGADSFVTPIDEVAEQPPVTAEQEPVVAEPAVPETATSPGFVDRLLANPLWLGAGAAVIALLGFFGIRRRRGVESGFQESILQAARGKSAAAQDSEIMESHHATRDSTSSASSLLSEFAVSDMGSMRSDGEADPLAEADVYLAYGRYQQAEDLIKEALQNNPEHEALDLKLLEVYQAGKNQAAFDDHAQTILARLESNDDPLWEKVAAMGRELSPENPMYHDGGAAEEHAGGQDAGMDAVGEATEFDIEEATRPVAEASQERAGDEAALGEEEGLDFDINLSFDSEEGQREEEPDSMEFTPPEGFGEELETGEPKLDLDMDSIEPDGAEQEPALDLDLAALDLDMAEAAEAEMEENGELADLDEVSTKLDLARAYIDMGDPDGAKSILDEVMDEGSDDQKDEARGILEQIS